MAETRRIEVFRPGTFKPMAGSALTFTAGDLEAIAAAYDPATSPAPVVVGHPETDAPAYGWARSFAYDAVEGRLTADIGDLDPSFADAVRAGRYRKISLSLFPPGAEANPHPESWYPKHIGFLGGAAPAVPGLRPVSLSADDGAVVFEFADATALRDVAGLFRGLRDFFIEQFGLEQADKTLPVWSIQWLDDAADRDPPSEARSFALPKGPDMTAAPDPNDLARRAADLDARERALAHQGHVAFAASLVADGRIVPAIEARVVGLLDALAPAKEAVVSFADGSGTRHAAPAEALREILEAMPKVVPYGRQELGAPPASSVAFAAPDGRDVDASRLDLHARALAYQAAHPGTPFLAAVRAVEAA